LGEQIICWHCETSNKCAIVEEKHYVNGNKGLREGLNAEYASLVQVFSMINQGFSDRLDRAAIPLAVCVVYFTTATATRYHGASRPVART
jgi:hypothetical protein